MQREIGIIIRVKDAAKAKAEINGIVDNKLLGNVKAATNNFNQMGKEVESSGQKARRAKDDFSSFFKNLTKGAASLHIIKRGLNMAFGSFEAGAGLERASVQFESSIGKINTMLPQLRAATRGTVEDMKLLQTANRAVIEGLDPRNLTKMYQMATVASRKLGLESEQSIQTISNAIIRQDESALTTLGTILKTNVGLKVQNAIMSKNAGVMSGAAAIAIRQSVIMAELNKRFSGFNTLQEDSVEIIQQFRAAMSNLRMSIGPVLGQFMAPLLKLAGSLANTLSDALRVLKDSPAFQTAARNIGVVLGVFTAAKVISGIMAVTKALGLFSLGIKGLAIMAGGLSVLKVMGLETNDLTAGFTKLSTAASVFFQLISSYDSNTGMSQILSADKEALGGLYTVIFTAAKAFKVLESVGKGTLQGIKNVIDFVTPVLGSFGTTLSSILDSIINNKPLLQSSLNQIERLASLVGPMVLGGALAFTLGKVLAIGAAFKGAAVGLAALFGVAKGIGVVTALGMAVKALGVAFLGLTAAMMSNPVGLAILGAGALGAGALYYATQGDSAPTSSGMNTSSTPTPPDLREQNVQSVSREEDSRGVKLLTEIRDSNISMNEKEEQRDIQNRVAPIDRTFLRR